MKIALAVLASAMFSVAASGQAVPTVYVDGPSDFSAALTAAINKKHVPVQVTLDEEHADYVLHVGGVANSTVSKWLKTDSRLLTRRKTRVRAGE
ncbi:MAG TPA: hypothetical protein VK638_52355 [Edaphobacter sp.]|nr:hypothetical protein [Edaphobacter sp.]